MKDAYSFDYTDAGARRELQAQRDAYERIFTRLGLEYVIVQADAGAMGGSRSEEFLHPTPVGEDTFVRSRRRLRGERRGVHHDGAARALLREAHAARGARHPGHADHPDARRRREREAPASRRPRLDRRGHAEERRARADAPRRHPRARRRRAARRPRGRPEARRGGLRARRGRGRRPTPTSAKHPGLVKGYIGPWSPEGAVLGEKSATGIRYLVDPRVVDGSGWITGANIDGQARLRPGRRPRLRLGRRRSRSPRSSAGDPAPDGSGPVELARGMEIGHVFQLGRKYAEALGLKVLDENGKLVTVTMGSYGIGVTRILAIIAEENNDDKGLIWPESVAPFDVHVVAAGRDAGRFEVAEELVGAARGRRPRRALRRPPQGVARREVRRRRADRRAEDRARRRPRRRRRRGRAVGPAHRRPADAAASPRRSPS